MTTERTPLTVELATAGHPALLAGWLEAIRADGHDILRDPTTGVTWFLSVADAEHLLTSPGVGAAVAMGILAASGVTDGPLHELWSDLMFGKDGDEHHRIRSTVARDLTARSVERLRPDVERVSTALLGRWEPGRTVDVWSTYALPLTARAACLLVGVPFDHADEIAQWSLALSRAFGAMDDRTVAEANLAAAQLCSHLAQLVASDALVPGGVWSELVRTGDHALSDGELLALGANLLFGGMDATAKAVTTGLAHLLDHPAAWAELVADPVGRADGAVAESLRFGPPAAGVIRLAVEPVACRGFDIDAFQLIGVSTGALCRDPATTERPEEFDLARPAGRHYAFGAGPHHCVGAAYARLILSVAFTHVATGFPGARLDAALTDLTWTADPFRGVVELPLSVPASPATPAVGRSLT